MCGILVAWSKAGAIDAAACRRAMTTMAWRGPDHAMSRVWSDRLFLGQNVLSITGRPDIENAYQRSRSGRWEVLYNGELYNCADLQERVLGSRPGLELRTDTDTEVLVNLHEVLPAEDVARRLDGMFAYALLDEQAQTLTFVRDPQGEKLLYVYEDERQVVVASEIRAILALAPHLQPDAQALRDYFHARHLLLGRRTVYPGIRELPPGGLETLALRTGTWTRGRSARLADWIDPARMEANARRSTDSLADELGALIDGCVREMLPRDRKYAAVVSGGVDSSLIAESVVRQGAPHMLVAVDSVGKDRLSADLSGFERVVGPVTTLSVDSAMYTAEVTPCQKACGSPLPSHSFVPQSQQSAVVRAAGCRVLFGGDGADELFGGYPAYLGCADGDLAYSPSPYAMHRSPRVIFEQDTPAVIQTELHAAWTEARAAYAFVDNACERQRLAMMYCDAVHQLPSVGLRSADVMSMMWSVETRSVFLRRPLVQFALNLPAAVKADPRPSVDPLMRAKPLLKHLFLRRFPRALLCEKQGFAGFPNESGAWLGDPADYVALDYLGIERGSLEAACADRDEAWKLINVEYFLRHASR